MLGEVFTVMAVLEATDRMSRVLEKIDGSLGAFSDTTAKAAESATVAGAKIDESLMQTASGADALELAAARTATAQEKLTTATAAQADAETALLNARAAAASEDELAAAAVNVAAAQEKATAATVALKDAQEALGSAKKAKASEEELAVATANVTAAQERATVATHELTAARTEQAALVAPKDIAAAADSLTAAEKRATKATDEVSAAQDRQAAVGRAAVLATGEGRAAADEAAASQARLTEQQARATAGAGIASKALQYGTLAVAAIGYESVKTAGNFESMTEHLVTDAGESQAQIGLIRSGMLALATTTGTTTDQMAAGMYHIESAGFHGKAALDVMKTAAEGAKVGGADLDTVAKALTGTMNAYNMSGDQATSMMNQLIATVGSGDMKMQDLAASLGNVAPLAAAAGVSFAQVGGAMATMTAQNMSAQQASQDLANTIRNLSNPLKPAIDEMAQLGLDSNDLSQNLGKRGLTGTMDILTQAVAAHTQGGQVLIDSLKSSKAAAADAEKMIGMLPSTVQKAAQGFLDGSVTAAQFAKDIKGLTPEQQHLAQQFEHVAKGTDSFNKLLATGSPAAQTYNAAMSKLLGGATGLNTALMITGGRAAAFNDSVKTVGEAASKTGDSVDNWDKIQGTFNQKMDTVKASVEAAGISIGTVLLPAVSKVVSVVADVIGPMATWIAQHQKLVGLIIAIVGPALAVVGVIKTISIVTKLWAAAQLILDAAMAANPIGLVVVALAALAGGLYYAWTHFSTFREVVMAVLNAVKDVAIVVWHALEIAWKGIAAGAVWLWHVLQSAWDGVVSGVTTVWHALESAWNAVWSVTSTVWGAISGFFNKWWPLLLVIFDAPMALLTAAWNHFHQVVFDTAAKIWGAISDFFVASWHAIQDAAKTAWGLVRDYVVNPILEVWSMLVSVWNTVDNWLTAKFNAIWAMAMGVWRSVKSAIIDPLVEAWHSVTDTGDKIGRAVSDAFNSAKTKVMSIVHDFESVGSDIVNGIVNGVTGAAHFLTDKLKNLANDALGAAKSFLGINSPSREFADQVGKWIPHGIAQGVQDHAGVAHAAIGALAGGLAGSASVSPAGIGGQLGAGFSAGLPLSGPGGGGGSHTTIIDLRGSTVMGNQAIDQLTDKIGRRLATAGLPGGGVHMRM